MFFFFYMTAYNKTSVGKTQAIAITDHLGDLPEIAFDVMILFLLDIIFMFCKRGKET